MKVFKETMKNFGIEQQEVEGLNQVWKILAGIKNLPVQGMIPIFQTNIQLIKLEMLKKMSHNFSI